MTVPEQVTVLVRDGKDLVQLSGVSDWEAFVIAAGVSSDPRSFHELGVAWQRYRPDASWNALDWTPADGRHEGGAWLLIDLAYQRLTRSDADVASAAEGPGAYVEESNGESAAAQERVWWNVPPWWEEVLGGDVREALPPVGTPREPVDFRGVLFGRAMADDIAARLVDRFAREDLPRQYLDWDIWYRRQIAAGRDDTDRPNAAARATMDTWYQATVRVHAEWLLTARADLAGDTPRAFLHRGRDWVDCEVRHRKEQWIHTKQRPLPLDTASHTYRHGPLGTAQVVMYYDFCREVILQGWLVLCQQPDATAEIVSRQIYDAGQKWLREGTTDASDGTRVADVIEAERRHMPQLAGSDPIDCDCPICRVMAGEQSGALTFADYDGHHLELDDEFAFSLIESRDDWQLEYGIFGDDDVEVAVASDNQAASAGGTDAEDASEFQSVWKGVSSEWNAMSPLGMSFYVAELVSDLMERQAASHWMGRLNEAFDHFHQGELAALPPESVVAPLVQTLEELGQEFPDLVSKAADLQSRLDEWCRLAAPSG